MTTHTLNAGELTMTHTDTPPAPPARLTRAAWREAVRAELADALTIAASAEAAHGMTARNTVNAYRYADALAAVARGCGA